MNPASKRRFWSYRPNFRRIRGLQWALVVLALATALLGPETSNARLEPFYLLRGRNFAQYRPRVLLVLDVSLIHF